MPVAKNLILVTPGPVKVPQIIRDYLVDPPCNYHRQESFAAMFGENQRDLKALLQLREPHAFFVTILLASGTGANEAALRALAAFGKGLILDNGFFGKRLADQCARLAIDHDVYRAPVDRPLDAADLDMHLAAARGRY